MGVAKLAARPNMTAIVNDRASTPSVAAISNAIGVKSRATALFVPSKRALCWLRETEEVALLHQPMNRFGRALHQQGVAKSQLDVLKMFPQVLALAMHCQNEHAITLLEIELMQRLAEKSGAI